MNLWIRELLKTNLKNGILKILEKSKHKPDDNWAWAYAKEA